MPVSDARRSRLPEIAPIAPSVKPTNVQRSVGVPSERNTSVAVALRVCGAIRLIEEPSELWTHAEHREEGRLDPRANHTFWVYRSYAGATSRSRRPGQADQNPRQRRSLLANDSK